MAHPVYIRIKIKSIASSEMTFIFVLRTASPLDRRMVRVADIPRRVKPMTLKL